MQQDQPGPPADKWVDHEGRPEGTVYPDKFGRERVVTAPMFEDDDGNRIYGDAAIAAGMAHPWGESRQKKASTGRPVTSKPKSTRSRSRESHRTRPGQRRTRSAQSADDEPPPAGPPPLWRHSRLGLIRRDRLPLAMQAQGAWS